MSVDKPQALNLLEGPSGKLQETRRDVEASRRCLKTTQWEFEMAVGFSGGPKETRRRRERKDQHCHCEAVEVWRMYLLGHYLQWLVTRVGWPMARHAFPRHSANILHSVPRGDTQSERWRTDTEITNCQPSSWVDRFLEHSTRYKSRAQARELRPTELMSRDSTRILHFSFQGEHQCCPLCTQR
jgi:hypothetical protein